ncbi:MAG: ATP-binding protein [Propionibacteriaceae bacterium]|jgi:predicted AAA+ superfamily ATPase|nr:ATP-binding protein [Propionibacteriaceae bacterium]
MERDVMRQLLDWRASARRKPLLLEGARQTGKTWLLRELGRQAYDQTAYVDFEQTPSLGAIFDGDFDAARIIAQLRVATGVAIQPGNTLVVLDEIQACPRAVTALKYLGEHAGDHHIACAGSLLGVALHAEDSFPVGKVNFVGVGPLTFWEFLRATGEAALADVLRDQDWELLGPFHDRLVAALRDYLFVGGMPEAVRQFAPDRDYSQARAVQLEILHAYDLDFSKHAPAEQVPRLRSIWQAVPGQLAKSQSRFAYSDLGGGARSRSHGAAIEWLAQAGVVVRVNRVGAPRMPLAGYADQSAFKLFLADVGLLGALAGLDATAVLQPNRLFTEFKGALVEQYAATQLTAAFGTPPHYWSNAGGLAEVDFVVQRADDTVPVEVKAGRNLKAQSLRVYREKFTPALAVRASLAPHQRHAGLVDLPLYALQALPRLDQPPGA